MMWSEMAMGFDIKAFEAMEKPIINAVSSCRVSKFEGVQLTTATLSTHYYLNPDVPELDKLSL
ncbi:hypothetical protein Tco_0163821, partial [Tanacetum coccineum]